MSRPFAEEFPHLTSLGRGCVLFCAGLGAGLAVIIVTVALGVPPYVRGWLACMAFLLASRLWKPEQ